MQIHTFGNKKNKPLLIMHGMLCNWSIFYNKLKKLEENYYLIIPAMTGCYDGSPDFESFEKECISIEEFVKNELDGKLYSAYGISQGATLIDELLSRNIIEIKYAILDGLYVANQGAIAGKIMCHELLKLQKSHGKLTPLFKYIMKLMGMTKKDIVTFECIYWNFSKKTAQTNLQENYTYKQKSSISKSRAKVYLWCGSKEKYAIKSHNIIKKYLKDYEEEIMDGYAHGQFVFYDNDKCCEKIKKLIN